MKVNVKFRGLKEIERALEQLPKRVDRKILNEGLLVAARMVRDDARAKVPLLRVPHPNRLRGTVKRSIQAMRIRPDKYSATVLVRVRPLTRRQIANFKRAATKKGVKWKTGADNPRDPFYWMFLEFGTSKMRARPFMRPAFENKKMQAVSASIAVFRERTQAELAKLGAGRVR